VETLTPTWDTLTLTPSIEQLTGAVIDRHRLESMSVRPKTCLPNLNYRSLQVYQRSYSQVGHSFAGLVERVTLKIVRQNPPRSEWEWEYPMSEWESPLSDSLTGNRKRPQILLTNKFVHKETCVSLVKLK
jgi:hypothetical protein